MTYDWRPEIVRLVQLKQAIAEADAHGLWEFHLPGVAATPADLDALETTLGARLDGQHRELLRYANGWPSFMQSVDLFGVDDLAGGPRMDVARSALDSIEPVVLHGAGLRDTRLLPIAASTVDLDVFVMPVINAAAQPPVVWFAGSEVDRFPTFHDFILAMIGYNQRELEVLRGEG